MTPRLWSLSYSPWSERARWALDYGRAPYRKRSYKPLFDELALRRALGRWRGPVSVPILETEGGVLDGGLAIAEYAEAHGEQPVIPPEQRSEVLRWDERASAAMSAGRMCSLVRTLRSPASMAELVPPNLQRVPGKLAIARAGIRRTMRKYAPVTPANPEDALVRALEELREALASGHETDGVRHLLPTFGYADMSIAQILAFVEPPKSHLRIGDATRETYRDGALAERFADLVEWRDGVYETFR
ncbi:MAG: glutathione S-transferase N-terminal domain-containing protein [Deltaproteobacteria bacterium]|nr:glutathione S-transferase N-terminal domain-containing protein [Deltaproteobacteria bacterium]